MSRGFQPGRSVQNPVGRESRNLLYAGTAMPDDPRGDCGATAGAANGLFVPRHARAVHERSRGASRHLDDSGPATAVSRPWAAAENAEPADAAPDGPKKGNRGAIKG